MFASETLSSAGAGTVRYTRTAIALHWLIAIVVIGQIALGWWMQEIPKQPVGPRVNAFNLHKSIGLTVLMLMVVRLAWRATHAPPPPVAMPAWQARAARAESLAALRVPVRAAAVGLSRIGVQRLSRALFRAGAAGLGGEERRAQGCAQQTCTAITSWILVGAIALHVAAALKHHFIDRDGLLSRMGSARARADPDRRRGSSLSRAASTVSANFPSRAMSSAVLPRSSFMSARAPAASNAWTVAVLP